MVATVAAFSTATAANLEPCNVVDILVVMHSEEGTKCTDKTDYNFLLEVTGGFTTQPEKFADICGNEDCKTMLTKTYTVIPNDCKIYNGLSFKSLTDPVYKTCFPKVSN